MSGPVSGFIRYAIHRFTRFEPFECRTDSDPSELLISVLEHNVMEITLGSPLTPKITRFGDVYKDWLSLGFKPAALHHIPPYIAYGIFERRWTCMHCVAFVERLQRKRLLEPTSPNPERFAKLRRCGEGKGAEATQAITQFPWKP